MIEKIRFITNHDGEHVNLYTLRNSRGMSLSITNFGCRVVELWVPDRYGTFVDVVLGYDSIDKYLNNTGERFLGAVCGRFANRIAKGYFTIDGKEYQLPINNNGQTLHGGIKGLDSVVWSVDYATDSRLEFSYLSPDMEEGFPGNLSIKMSYELTEDNEFRIEYSAITDKPTPVNLTHHSFFNLKGEGCGSINDHILQINADRFIPIDRFYIPLGEISGVELTPFDFREYTPIGLRLGDPHEQLKMGHGYDHCWVVNGVGMRLAATVIEPSSGRTMEVWSDQPGIQFYGGNFFDGRSASKAGIRKYDYQGAFALETQMFPDAPNHANFSNAILLPEQKYTHCCSYKFAVM